MLNKYLDKLERKFRRFAIPNLMLYIVLGMGVFYIANMILTTNPDNKVDLYGMIYFDRAKIMHGEIWRVISFILMPPKYMIIFTVFALYFYWMIGEVIERNWGSLKFNAYYFTGIIGCIIAGFITGYTSNLYLNLSLFIAFAILFPNEEIRLSFLIPIKMKWLAIADGVLLVYQFIVGSFDERIYLLFSVANILLFFGKELFSACYYTIRRIFYNAKK